MGAASPPNFVSVLSISYRFCDPNFSVFVVIIEGEKGEDRDCGRLKHSAAFHTGFIFPGSPLSLFHGVIRFREDDFAKCHPFGFTRKYFQM